MDSNLHFGGVHIDVNLLRINLKMKHCKGKFMLHQIIAISLFQGFAYGIVFYEPSVYKVDLKVPVGTIALRFPDITRDLKAAALRMEGKRRLRHLSAVNTVDDLL